MTPDVADAEAELRHDIGGFTHHPLAFIRYAYPWGEGELAQCNGPYPWQRKVLSHIHSHLTSPSTRHTPLLLAVASGHGIGKSALASMVINWGMSTCEDTKIVVTANTERQLATKTVPEVSKWLRLSLNRHWWEAKATFITVREEAHSKVWRCDFIPWSEHNIEAFSGLHNRGKRIIVLFDEASAISDKVWETTEGALTDEETEIIWLVFGNPTRNVGRFRECFGRLKHRWVTMQVDSRDVPGTNREQIQTWIDDYGDDSDFVRVRVKGEFPRAGSNQLIPSDAVEACRKLQIQGYERFPKILGVDVARFGDDQTVVMLRQGRRAEVLGKYRGLDTAQVAAQVASFIDEHDADAVVVDADGIGNTVYDQLKFQGYGRKLVEFHGGHPAFNVDAYFNRRAEVWTSLRDSLRAGMQIPDDAELAADLVSPEYGFSSRQQIQLEKKDDMKKRGLSSPDLGDALAMTFAVQLAMKPEPKSTEGRYVYPTERQLAWLQ